MYATPLRPAVLITVGFAGQIVHAFAVSAFLGINQVALIAGITQRANVITLLRQPALVAAVVYEVVLGGDVGNLPALRKSAVKVAAG